MRVLISMAASVMLLLALVGPVAATGPGCSDYGAATVDGAQNARPFGQLVSSVNHGAFAPAFNNVSELVQFEHGLYCSR
jgi:hypothetical protein